MEDSVLEGCRHDDALFRFADDERVVSAGAVHLIDELVLQLDKILFEMPTEHERRTPPPLLADGLPVGVIEILEVVDFRV